MSTPMQPDDPMMGVVFISVEEYKQLKEDSDFLANLRAVGVDNWDGYRYGYGLEEEDSEDR